MASKGKTVRKKLGKRKENEVKEGEVELLKNQLVRALADYDNLRKRVERERDEFGSIARATLMVRILPIFDMLEGAQTHLKDSGLAITIDEFGKVLREEGFEKIDVKVGDSFDENLHEAVELVDSDSDSDKGSGQVAEIILPGWRITDGPVIRPAKVKVAKN